MKLLLKKVLIADNKAPDFGKIQDILIENGRFTNINNHIETEADETISGEELVVSSGWVDVFSDFAEPGYEHRETIATGAAAAVIGGFSHVFLIPNTKPVIQRKPEVNYLIGQSEKLPIYIHPIGAVSKNCEGKDLAEMYEMQQAGAVAFSDGINPVQSAGLLVKALQYIKAFDGTIIQLPMDKSLGVFGLMTEGIISTQMGLPGSPTLAETAIIKRDIDLLQYTQSRLHITGVSTAESVALIAQAKSKGLNLTCSVTPYHLFFCDEDLHSYDTNLKVNPPLRTRADMMALRQAVLEGTIDCISSHHSPQSWDNKTCEFEYASNGMIGLQTSFAVLNSLFPSLSKTEVANLMGNRARSIFNLPQESIAIGADADITIFETKGNFSFSKKRNQSKSANSAFMGLPLKGNVLGVYAKGKWNKNEFGN